MLKKGQNETVKPREKTWFNPNIINITSTETIKQQHHILKIISFQNIILNMK